MKHNPLALLVGVALVAGCAGGDSETSSDGTSSIAPPAITAEDSTLVTTPTTIDTSPPDTPAGAVCRDAPTAIEGTSSLSDVVMLVDERGSVMSLDVATGEVTCVRPYESDGEPAPWVRGDPAGVLRMPSMSSSMISTAGTGGGNWLVPDDPTARVVTAVMGRFFPTDWSDTLWAFAPDVLEVWLAGYLPESALDLVVLAAGERAIAADGRGGLVIESGDSNGREYRTLSIEGASTPLWIGTDLVAVGADTIVGVICESNDACRLTVANRTSGAVVDLGVAPAAFASGQDFVEQFVTLSPDEDLLATPTVAEDLHSVTASQNGPMVIDVTNGSVVELEGGVWPMSTHNLTWSTDGSVLYWIDVDGGLRAWSPSDPDTVVQLGARDLPMLRNVTIHD